MKNSTPRSSCVFPFYGYGKKLSVLNHNRDDPKLPTESDGLAATFTFPLAGIIARLNLPDYLAQTKHLEEIRNVDTPHVATLVLALERVPMAAIPCELANTRHKCAGAGWFARLWRIFRL